MLLAESPKPEEFQTDMEQFSKDFSQCVHVQELPGHVSACATASIASSTATNTFRKATPS